MLFLLNFIHQTDLYLIFILPINSVKSYILLFTILIISHKVLHHLTGWPLTWKSGKSQGEMFLMKMSGKFLITVKVRENEIVLANKC